MRSRSFAHAALALIVLSLAATPACAHVERGQAAGFLAGLHHPISGLDHVLAMVSVGLWGAQLGPPAVWLLPVTFPMVMAIGGFIGLIGVPLPGVEVGIALSAILLRFVWINAPKWLGALIGLALGWLGVLVFPQILARTGLSAATCG